MDVSTEYLGTQCNGKKRLADNLHLARGYRQNPERPCYSSSPSSQVPNTLERIPGSDAAASLGRLRCGGIRFLVLTARNRNLINSHLSGPHFRPLNLVCWLLMDSVFECSRYSNPPSTRLSKMWSSTLRLLRVTEGLCARS